MKIKKNFFLDFFYLATISLLVIALSNLFSIYHSDFHHWGFIASHTLDYINGGKLFEEVTVQYGIGQFVIFKFINYFYEINFTSIGVITSVFYTLNLIIIYFIIKRLSSIFYASFIVTLILIVNPFVEFPWPDYMAGLWLSLFCFFLICGNPKKNSHYLLAGLCLFLSIIFRTSYILNIFLTCITYFIFLKNNKKFYNKFLVNSLLTFLFLFTFYVAYLLLEKNFINWFYQGIGVFENYAFASEDPAFNTKGNLAFDIYDKYGYWSLVFFQTTKLTAKFIVQLIFPTTLENFIIFIFYFINIFFIFSFFNKKIKNVIVINTKVQGDNLLFIALLGFFGIIQSIQFFNFFKNINSSSAIFLTTATVLISLKRTELFNNKRCYYIFSFIILFFFIFKFHNTFKKNFKINNNNYFKSSIDFFGKRKFIKEDLDFYNSMKEYLCEDNKRIINFTLDTNFVYLCSRYKYYFYKFNVLNLQNDNIFKNFNNNTVDNSLIFVTTTDPLDIKKFSKKKIVEAPKSIAYWIERTPGPLPHKNRSNKVNIYKN